MARGERIGWIEWVRALGAVSIVLLHVLVTNLDRLPYEQTRWVVYNVVGITLTRWAVPAFFMVSGYLLLDPERTFGWRQVWRHERRMLVVLATFGTLFALLEEGYVCVSSETPIDVGIVVRAVVDVLTQNTWGHLWFVYAIAVVYLFVPALRSIWSHVGARAFGWMTIVLFVLVLVVPTLCGTAAPDALCGLACFCTGGCLRLGRPRKLYVALGCLSLAVMLRACVPSDPLPALIVLQGSCFAAWYALLVIEAIRTLAGEAPVPQGGIVERLAQDSFGIYILHMLFVHIMFLLINPLLFPPFVREAGAFAVALAASIASTELLRRIPLFSKVL